MNKSLKDGHWTVKQFANHFEMAELTVRKLYGKRQLRVVRIGRTVRIPAEEVQRFIDRNTTPAL